MTTATKWDEAKASEAATSFEGQFKQLEAMYPDAIHQLRQLWQGAYMTAGHKRLARVLCQKNGKAKATVEDNGSKSIKANGNGHKAAAKLDKPQETTGDGLTSPVRTPQKLYDYRTYAPGYGGPSAEVLAKHKGKKIHLSRNPQGGYVVPLSQIGILDRSPHYGLGTIYIPGQKALPGLMGNWQPKDKHEDYKPEIEVNIIQEKGNDEVSNMR